MIKFIKKFNKTTDQKLTSLGLLILRVGVGAIMATAHGWGKLTSYSERMSSFADPFGLGPAVTLTLVVFAEFFCSILVILGAFTRLAVIPLIITMATAAFIIHADDPFGRKELAFMFLTGFLALLFAGAGKYSIDGAMGGKYRKQ
jgi:putative oxidoreductase